MRNFVLATSTAALCVTIPHAAAAQHVAPVAVTASAETQRPTTVATPVAAKPVSKVHRWFDIQTGLADVRYRLVESSADVRTASQIQHRQTLKAALKLDPKGRYAVQTGFGTGSNFVGSWDPTGAGTGDPTWDLALRMLYASAKPVKGLELQVGGIGPVRGESTEITSYDNDGFLIGERVSVKRPKTFYLDDISVTTGYLGDVTTPNVLKRFDRMNDHNYTQVLAAKKLNARVAFSVDWTSVAGVETWRQAARVATKELRVVDAVRVELYERVEGATGEGFALSAEKAVTKKLAVSGGYADIDRNYGTLNGDRFQPGRRVFTEGRVTLTPELSVSVFYGRAVNNDFAIPNKTRLDAVVTFNVLKALQRSGAW